MGAKITSTDNEHLKGGEQRLVNALRAGEACEFVYEGKNKEPDAARTLRGDVLGQLLREELVEGETKRIKLGRAVNIEGAIITGILDMSDTNTGLVLRIEHSVFKGKVDLQRTRVKQLSLAFSIVSHVEMGFIRIKTHLDLNEVRSNGEFAISYASIGGQITALNSTFANSNGSAIYAQGAKIKGGVFLRGAEILGTANFTRAEIGGQFAAEKAKFLAHERTAINCQGAKIIGGVILDGAIINGMANFSSAEISGQITTFETSFCNTKYSALNFQGAIVKNVIFLSDLLHPPIGNVNLTNAQLGHIIIDQHTFPIGRLVLAGTCFESLTNRSDAEGKPYKGWLQPIRDTLARPVGYHLAFKSLFARLLSEFPENTDKHLWTKSWTLLYHLSSAQTGYARSPFAYREFARSLDANGHENEAKAVRVLAARAYTKRTKDTILSHWTMPFAQPMKSLLQWLYRGWRWFLWRATGYGTQPHLIMLWLFISWGLSTMFFFAHHGTMTPSRETFYMTGVTQDKLPTPYKPGAAIPEGYPKFSPSIYALDTMLPIVDIAQETHWRPRNGEDSISTIVLYFNRFLILWGWFLTTIGIAGFSGLFTDKREP